MKHLAILAILLASLIAIEAVKLDLAKASFKNLKNASSGIQKTPRDFKRDDGSSYSSMCWYQSSDGFYYDLSALQTYYGSWVNVDASGNTWYWNVCGDLSNMNTTTTEEYYYEKELKRSATSCSPDSAICIKTVAGEWINAGKAYSALWSDSVFGTANGVTITIYEGDMCGPERSPMVTTVQHVCQQAMNTQKLKKSDVDPTNTYGMMEIALVYEDSPCYPQMYIYSPFACPYTSWEETADGGDDDDHNDDDDEEYEGGHGGAFFILSSLAVCCCCTLMCCCFRKRRCQMQKSSYCRSSEMQPVPTSEPRGPYPTHNQIGIPMQAPGPYFQPHQMQAQMQAPVQYYYYPPNGGAMPPFVPLQQMNMPVVPLDQVASDEELARQLQAQINQE